MQTIKQIFLFFTLFYFVTLSGCKIKDPIDTKNIFEKASKGDSLSYYFPPILNDKYERKNKNYQDFEQKWYSSSLYSFKEPILYTKNDSQTIYRLLWLRSFSKPVCFVMKAYEDQYYLNTKTLDRLPSFHVDWVFRGKDSSGKEIIDTVGKADRFALIDFNSTKILTNGQWDQIQNYLKKIDFWNGPIPDPKDDQHSDGAKWIFEGRKNNQYHFIIRRNMHQELEPFGKYLIKLSGVDIKEDDIY